MATDPSTPPSSQMATRARGMSSDVRRKQESAVTANSDPAVTMSERIRQYVLEYPNMKAKGICQALGIDYRKHGSLARKVLSQERWRDRCEAGVWDVTRCLNPSLHRVVFQSGDCAPSWLVELVVSQGGGFGWRMVKAGNLVYYLREIPHFAQIRLFPKSGKLLIYTRGEQSQDRLMKLKGIMTCLCRDMAGGVLDGRNAIYKSSWNDSWLLGRAYT
jgi:hypothetical protein